MSPGAVIAEYMNDNDTQGMELHNLSEEYLDNGNPSGQRIFCFGDLNDFEYHGYKFMDAENKRTLLDKIVLKKVPIVKNDGSVGWVY
ncbi:hypothetical protein GGF42_004051 [Coemansia sp. RSA 2424]|nr:hypothetical protein GGF42_004051 [Coemansia sp. RSA 2424]